MIPSSADALHEILDRRPLLLAVAGPNGAGKSTFFASHLADLGLRWVNADVLGRELGLSAYDAADAADAIRRSLLAQGESFAFETVFSDPVGDKLAFLGEAAAAGFTVVLCFIGVASAMRCDERVAMRVSQGGHDVPADKVLARYPRTLTNLALAMVRLPHVYVFDNDDLSHPFRLVAVCHDGQVSTCDEPPSWLPTIRR